MEVKKNLTNENSLINKFDSNDYSELFELMFSDLRRLSKGEKEVFLDLFYNRDGDFAEFKTAAKNLFETGFNLVIKGDAGIGKSDFIYRLFYDKSLLKDLKLFPIMIDYRTEDNIDYLKRDFIEKVEEYFKSISQTITLSQNVEENIYLIKKILLNYSSTTPKSEHLIIFIDDLDYAEQKDLFPILKFFTPFAKSTNVSIVLSVRPTLYETVQRNDSTYSFYFTRTVKTIELNDLCIHNIIAMRLAPILATLGIEENKGLLKNVFHKLKPLKSAEKQYVKVLKKLGIKNLESLENFHFPFTEEYSSFMREISSNNIRETFDIAFKSLLYILDNYNKLEDEPDKETGEKRKKITHGQIVDLFTTNDRYTLFDLHKIKNQHCNSLYYNILEAVKFCPNSNLDVCFYKHLETMGHKREGENGVDNALKLLARKSNRLLSSNDFTYAQDNVKEPVKYTITKKGEFYLFDISVWQEYKNKFDSTTPTKLLKDLIEKEI